MAVAKEAMSMNSIELQDAGKRFNRSWVFRHLSHSFQQDSHTVILGPNGSGKSTLLQAILGSQSLSDGSVTYKVNGVEIKQEEALGFFSLATPYLELIEEYTLREMLLFHGKLVPFRSRLSISEIISLLYLDDAANRPLKQYSSGMKQRVKLGLALLTDTPFVLLDEPCANLDSNAMKWYSNLVESHKDGRVIIVCSNAQEQEYSFCSKQLVITDYSK